MFTLPSVLLCSWELQMLSALEFLTSLAHIIKEWSLMLCIELFSNSKKDSKLGFLNVALVGLFKFSHFINEMENLTFWILA